MSDKVHISISTTLKKPNSAEVQKFKKDLETQIGKININTSSGKGIKLLDSKEIDLYTQKMKNALERLKIGKDSVFAKPEITKEVNDFTNELSKLGTAGAKSTKELNVQFDTLKTNVAKTSNEFKNVNHDGYNFVQMIELAAKKIAIWAVSTTLVYGTLSQIRQGFQYITELDKNLNSIRIVTGMTAQETADLAVSYNNLSKELGATTNQLTSGALEWFRQGKSVAESQELVKASIIESKLAAIDSAQATEYLTSTLNGYQMESKDVMTVIDQMVAIDNAAATSVAELSEALKRSSNSASQAGVPLSRLLGYIGEVSSVSRKSASSIGESFKTIFARMQDIKLGNLDEDGMGLSDVENVLNSLGVALRKDKDTFRDMADVLDNISSKWLTYSDTQKSAIAKSISGVRQRENFLVLMNNYKGALELEQKALESNGLALDRYGIYNEGVESKVNSLQSTLESLYDTVISSDFYKSLIDGSSDLIQAIDNTIKQFGLLNTAIYTVSATLLLFKGKALIGAISGVGGLGAALLALATNPMTWVVLGLGALTLALVKYADEVQKARQKTEEIKNAYIEFNNSLNSGKIDDVTNSLKRLTESVDYEGAKKKIADLNDEIERLQNQANNSGTNGRGQGAKGNERSSANKKLIQATGLRDELQSQVDMVDNAKNALHEMTDNEFMRNFGIKPKTTSSNTSSDTASTSTYIPKNSKSSTTSKPTPDLESPYKSLYNTIRDLNFELSKQQEILSQTKEADQIPILTKRNELLKKQQDNLHALNDARRAEQATLSKTSDRYQELEGKMQETSLEWWRLDSAQKANITTMDEISKKAKELAKQTYEEQTKNLEDVQKQIVEIIKKRYELELDEAEKAHKKKLDNYDDELNIFKDNIDKQIDYLDKLYDKQNFEKNQNKATQTISELTNERNALSMAANSGDLVAINRIKEIDEELAKERESLVDLQQDREHELRKQNLEDIQRAKEIEINTAKEIAEAKFETVKANYEKLLTEGNLNAEANKALTSGMVTDINGKLTTVQEAFTTFSNTFGETLGALGSNIKTEFIDKLEKAKKLIDSMGGLSSDETIHTTTKSASIPRYASGTDDALGGWSLVGEKGAELINLPKHSQVFSSDITQKLLGSLNNLTPNISTFKTPSLNNNGNNNGSIRLGDVVLQISGSVDRSLIPTIVEEVAKAQRRELNLVGIRR